MQAAPKPSSAYHRDFRPLRSLPREPLVSFVTSLGPQLVQVDYVATASSKHLHVHVEVLMLPN